MSNTVNNTQTQNTEFNIKNNECPICFDSLNGDEFCDCMQCGYVCCNKCSYKMISVCPDIRAGIVSNCPMCRNKEKLITWDKLHNDKEESNRESNSFVKHVLATVDKTEHKFKNTHCCNTGDDAMDFEAIIEHHPCSEGCKSCHNSKLSIKSITINGMHYKLKYVDNKLDCWSLKPLPMYEIKVEYLINDYEKYKEFLIQSADTFEYPCLSILKTPDNDGNLVRNIENKEMFLDIINRIPCLI